MDTNLELCREAASSEEYLDMIVEYSGDLAGIESIYRSGCIQTINTRYAVVHIPRDVNPELSVAAYGYSSIPQCLGTLDINSVDRIGGLQVESQPALQLTGQGVLIGFVDTGIDYTNPLFQNGDGSSRILSIWDQTISTGDPPQDLYYGTEYSSNEINLALQSADPFSVVPSRDEDGHGTMLAGLAAGNRDIVNGFSGVAAGSTLVVVKLKPAKENLKHFYAIPSSALAYQSNDIMMGVKYLESVARQLQRPMVICIGLGTSSGGYGLREVLAQYLASVGDARGMCVVAAAGNEGLGRRTYFGSVNPLLGTETVELRVGAEEGFTVELWGNTPNIYTVSIVSPVGEYVQRTSPRATESLFYRFLLEETELRIDYQINERSSGQHLTVMTFYRPTVGIWRFEVYKDMYDTSNYYMKLPIGNFISSETYFLNPSPNSTMVNPAYSIPVIAATAYNYRNNSIYIHASKGLENEFITKPDIAAPGVNLLVPTLEQGFASASGTSLAAASTAGAAALVLEWGIIRGNSPNINSFGVRNFMIRGADREMNVSYPNATWGYGRLNLYQSFISLLRV